MAAKFVDLTLTLDNKTPVFPGDPPVIVEPIASLEKDGCSIHSFSFPGHCSTHLDAPAHFIAGGLKIDQIPMEWLVGEGIKISQPENTKVIELSGDLFKSKPKIVLIQTNYITTIQSKSYFTDHPLLSEKSAKILIAAGVKMVGMDWPSPDKEPFNIHKILLAKNVLILENVCNLDLLPASGFRVHVLPLKSPTDGAPARVIAEIMGESL